MSEHFDDFTLPAVCLTCTPPHWWGALAPEDWTPDARWGLSDRVLEPLELLFDRRWSQARAGDAAAAIALAIEYDRDDVHDSLRNAMMSALVANALLESPAARVVLIHILSRRSRLDPAFEHALQGWKELERDLSLTAARSDATDDEAVAAPFCSTSNCGGA